MGNINDVLLFIIRLTTKKLNMKRALTKFMVLLQGGATAQKSRTNNPFFYADNLGCTHQIGQG